MNWNGFHSPKHQLRRCKYLILALIAGEMPRKRITNLMRLFDESLINPDTHFNKLIYITWKSPKIPKSLYLEISHLVELNSGFIFVFFDDKQQEKWMRQNYANSRILSIYLDSLFGASRADIFRYCIIEKYGGIYFSINFGASKKFEDLPIPSEESFVVLSELGLNEKSPPFLARSQGIFKNKSYLMEVIVGSKDNLLMKRCIANIEKRYNQVKGKEFRFVNHAIWYFSGPVLFTDSVLELLNSEVENFRPMFKLEVVPPMYGNSIYRFEKAKYRYISSPSYIGYKDCKIVR